MSFGFARYAAPYHFSLNPSETTAGRGQSRSSQLNGRDVLPVNTCGHPSGSIDTVATEQLSFYSQQNSTPQQVTDSLNLSRCHYQSGNGAEMTAYPQAIEDISRVVFLDQADRVANTSPQTNPVYLTQNVYHTQIINQQVLNQQPNQDPADQQAVNLLLKLKESVNQSQEHVNPRSQKRTTTTNQAKKVVRNPRRRTKKTILTLLPSLP